MKKSGIKYPGISFDMESANRHMYAVGHVLEFQRPSPATNFAAERERLGVIVDDFEAWYEHEISVKKGDTVQVKKRRIK